MIDAPFPTASANSCTCELCMFSPRWLPMSTRHWAFLMSVRSGDPTSSPNVRRKPTSRGPRHCANDGAAIFGRPERLQRVLEEIAADAMGEQGDRFGSVCPLDRVHLLADVCECFVPGHLHPLFTATVALPDERRLQPVRIVVRTDAACPARTQPSAAQRIQRIPFDLPERTVADVRDRTAFPETDVAKRRDRSHALLPGRPSRHRVAARPWPTPTHPRRP